MLFDLILTEPKIYEPIFIHICQYLTFKDLIIKTRLFSKQFLIKIEQKLKMITKNRLLNYNMKPGYICPAKSNRILSLANKVNVTMNHYYPEYNQWIFQNIREREMNLTLDELNNTRTSSVYNMLKFQRIKYLKIMNA